MMATAAKPEAGSADDEVRSRRVRAQLRGIQNKVEEKRENMTAEDAVEILNQVNNVFGEVRTTREAVQDMSVLTDLALVGRQRALELTSTFVDFNDTDFTTHLRRLGTRGIRHAGDDDDEDEAPAAKHVKLNWTHVGSFAEEILRSVPRFNIMYGPIGMPIVKKVREKPQKHVKKKEPEVEVQPTQKEFTEAEDKDLTTERVREIFMVLRKAHKKKGISKHSFFDVVVNPDSFSETIENVFHLSFLVKDGYVKIEYQQNEPYVGLKFPSYLLSDKVFVDIEHGKGKVDFDQRKQLIVSMTYSDWVNIIKTRKFKKTFIPSHYKSAQNGHASAAD